MSLLPPHLGDKLVDWQLLAAAGGMELLVDKRVLEFGPSYGIDIYALAPYTERYVAIESAPDVTMHVIQLYEAMRAQGHRQMWTVGHNLQKPLPHDQAHFSDATFDLVIDFGTIDNVLGGDLPYREGMRVLKPGGVFLTTYANWRHFKADKSDCGDEVRWHPDQLALLFETELNGSVFVRQQEDQPRAAMAVRKR